MKKVIGNIWDFHDNGDFVVIPTNVGFKLSRSEAILGRGLAKQALDRFPELSIRYGEHCHENLKRTGVVLYFDWRLVMFPTKPFNESTPWLSWQSDSSVPLIERGLRQMNRMIENGVAPSQKIAFPLLGCGEGGLKRSLVEPLMDSHLKDDQFYLVLPPQRVLTKYPVRGTSRA